MSRGTRVALATIGLVCGGILFTHAIITPGSNIFEGLLSVLLISINIVALVGEEN